jgi:hypothetical protein
MVIAPMVAAITAMITGERLSSSPAPTPVSATCPTPSPIRASRRCTR